MSQASSSAFKSPVSRASKFGRQETGASFFTARDGNDDDFAGFQESTVTNAQAAQEDLQASAELINKEIETEFGSCVESNQLIESQRLNQQEHTVEKPAEK